MVLIVLMIEIVDSVSPVGAVKCIVDTIGDFWLGASVVSEVVAEKTYAVVEGLSSFVIEGLVNINRVEYQRDLVAGHTVLETLKGLGATSRSDGFYVINGDNIVSLLELTRDIWLDWGGRMDSSDDFQFE